MLLFRCLSLDEGRARVDSGAAVEITLVSHLCVRLKSCIRNSPLHLLSDLYEILQPFLAMI